jgi:hypothetical protein
VKHENTHGGLVAGVLGRRAVTTARRSHAAPIGSSARSAVVQMQENALTSRRWIFHELLTDVIASCSQCHRELDPRGRCPKTVSARALESLDSRSSTRGGSSRTCSSSVSSGAREGPWLSGALARRESGRVLHQHRLRVDRDAAADLGVVLGKRAHDVG